MNTTTKTLLVVLSLWFHLPQVLLAQDTPTNDAIATPVKGEQATQPRNTFIDYTSYISSSERFRFGKELKKVKKEEVFLEYAAPNNAIRISKYDYVKLMRRAVNQSETKTEFMNRISKYFVEPDDQFVQEVNFESLYDATRPYTFHGYFDGLPRIR